MTMFHVKRRIKGFTLIELLVVIAIIALLLSIVTPALRKAKEAARSVICRSNFRQVGVGFGSYYVENNDEALTSSGGEDFWFIQIAPYLGDGHLSRGGDADQELRGTMQLLKCAATKPPLEPLSTTRNVFGQAKLQYRYSQGDVENVVGSYAINGWVGGWDFLINADSPYCPNPSQAPANLRMSFRQKNANRNRADVPLVAEGIWVDMYPESTDRTPDAWPAGKDLSTGNTDKATGGWGLGRVTTNRHGMDTNLLYCDGHVDKIGLEDLWTQQWHREYEKQYDVTIEK